MACMGWAVWKTQGVVTHQSYGRTASISSLKAVFMVLPGKPIAEHVCRGVCSGSTMQKPITFSALFSRAHLRRV